MQGSTVFGCLVVYIIDCHAAWWRRGRGAGVPQLLSMNVEVWLLCLCLIALTPGASSIMTPVLGRNRLSPGRLLVESHMYGCTNCLACHAALCCQFCLYVWLYCSSMSACNTLRRPLPCSPALAADARILFSSFQSDC